MLSKREQTLLLIFGGMVAFLLLMGVRSWLGDAEMAVEMELKQARQQLDLVLQPVDPSDNPEAMAQRLAAEEARFAPHGASVYDLGLLIKKRIETGGLSLNRYKTVRAGEEDLLEFSFEGSAEKVFRFLFSLEKEEKNLTVSYLSIKPLRDSDLMDVLVRLGYVYAEQ